MGKPTNFHKRTAMMLAAQLPDDKQDCQMVLIALSDLVERFLSDSGKTAEIAQNVLPFLVS